MKHETLLPFLLLLISICYGQEGPTYNEWNNIEVRHVNTEKPHATMLVHPTAKQALENKKSEWKYSLNGKWYFHMVDKPSERSKDFYKKTFDVSSWSKIKVPSVWQQQGHGVPIVTNTTYPFPIDTTLRAPTEYNEVGSYKRDFELPKNWNGKNIFVHFAGVNSAMYLWVNGRYVGYSQGSRTPMEFNITNYLNDGKNTISVQVYRWSDASYFEDQDFWRMSGIHREVYLWAAGNSHIRDFTVKSNLDDSYKNGILNVSSDVVHYNSKDKAKFIKYKLYNESGDLIKQSSNLKLKDASSTNWNVKIKNVNHWNAEKPYLYKLLIQLLDSKENDVEALTQDVGFRRIEILKNGRFYINGQDVLIKGANRHEHDPETWQTGTVESAIKDMELMKQNNFNSIRTSHYPNDPSFYQLANKHGFYIMDEANVENHGLLKFKKKYEAVLNNKSCVALFLDRVQRMYERDKNQPSIVIWSLGNEFMHGEGSIESYKWLKEKDPSRPVNSEPSQYGITNNKGFCDFKSRMYMAVEEMDGTLDNPNLTNFPIILIEYAHAHGNSTGNLDAYWNRFYADNRARGGFVWDWRDQGINVDLPKSITYNGKNTFIAYGGWLEKKADITNKYGVKYNTGTCMDGLITSDWKVKPGLKALTYVQRYIHVKPLDIANGKFQLKNWYDFRNAKDMQIGEWQIIEQGKVIATGNLPELNMQPRQTMEFSIPVKSIKPNPGLKYHVNFIFKAKESAIDFVKKNTVIGWDQFELPISKELNIKPKSSFPKLNVKEETELITINNNNVSIIFDKTESTLTTYKINGIDYISLGARPDFWRSLTANDQGAGLKSNNKNQSTKKLAKNSIWYGEDKKWEANEIKVSQDFPGKVTIKATGKLLQNRAIYSITYNVFGNGEIVTKIDYSGNKDLPPMIRMGSLWKINKSFENIQWFGRGPWPTYSDRKFEMIGIYNSTISDNYINYFQPQENGNKVDVSWFKLTDNQGNGLLFSGDKLSVNAQWYSHSEMSNKGYSWQLNKDNHINLNIDFAQMGVGGDTSWGAIPHEQYLLKKSQYSYSYKITPIIK